MTRAAIIRRTLLTRQWALAALGVIAAIILCILLGLWQYGRYEGKVAHRDLVTANYSAPAVPVSDVLADTSSALPADQQWRQVRLEGEYCTDPDCMLYVRNRTLDENVGFWQLVPFRTDHGTLLVVRGWVGAQETESAPQDPPAPPSGRESIVVHLRAAEPAFTDRTNPPGQVQAVAIDQISSLMPADAGTLYASAFGEIVSEQPAASSMPAPLEKPDVGLGPHLSYAVQWWAFALFFPIAWVVSARRAVREELEDAAEERAVPGARAGSSPDADTEADGADARSEGPRTPRPSATGARTRSRRPVRPVSAAPRRRGRDEEEEDALVDRRTP